MASLFPINALRNAGLLLAATPLVLMMDLDMLIGRELSTVTRDVDRQVQMCLYQSCLSAEAQAAA